MARKAEVGIDYFPVNTDIIHNPKVKLVVAEFGSKTTWAVLLPLYCKIYREKGYWIDWFDEDSKLLFATDECKLELSIVNEVVSGCIRRSLFDKGVFDMFGVLTSDRIQENYFEATARRKSVEFIDEFLIENSNVNVNRDNVNVIELDVNILNKKVNINSQKKKEKENKKKIENEHTPEENLLFEQFQDWLKRNASRVNQLKEPLTIEQYFELREKHSRETITNVLKAMQNKADLLKKYQSAYLTIDNWCKRENSNENGQQSIQQPTINDALKAAKAS